MGLIHRFFGRFETTRDEPVEVDGHVHAPDAAPDDVVLPKQRRSSQWLLAGEPPRGWERDAVESTGGAWPWGSVDSSGGGGDAGGGGDGNGGGGSL